MNCSTVDTWQGKAYPLVDLEASSATRRPAAHGPATSIVVLITTKPCIAMDE